MSAGLDAAGAVAVKDLRVWARGRPAVGVVLPFALTLLAVLGLSTGPDGDLLAAGAPVLLWLAVALSAVFAVRVGWEGDGGSGGLEALVLAPVPRAALLLGKAVAAGVQLLACELVGVPLAAALLGVHVASPVRLGAALVLGTVGVVVVASLSGALAEVGRHRETVLPLLVLPLVVPVVVVAVRATALAMAGRTGATGGWLAGLLALDVLVAGAALLFSALLED